MELLSIYKYAKHEDLEGTALMGKTLNPQW